jgi:formylglycine-generating enzyme required for sulfatase activity
VRVRNVTNPDQPPIPQELAEQIARGNCTLLLGPGGDLDGLAQALAEECGYPPEKADRSLPAVARCYAHSAGCSRNKLIVRLREWLARDGARPTPLHRALAGLPVNCIVDFGYDDRLETALRRAGRSCDLVVGGDDWHYTASTKVLLVKPYGTLDRPESLVLTKDEFGRLRQQRRQLIERLQIWAAERVLLWVEIDPADPYLRRLRQAMIEDISPRHRREYAVAAPGEMAEAWAGQGVAVIAAPDPAAWLTALTQAVSEVATAPTPPIQTPYLGRRPYKFLDFYTAEDTDLFFGREQWAADLTACILAHPLVVLFGRSGMGKTSLLLAGALPRLEARDCWPIYARPGADPLAAVRAAAEEKLSAADRVALAGIAELGPFLEAAGERVGKTPVVVLDQAEECFTALARPVRERWVAALARALGGAAGDARWVLSLREDFAADLHDWKAHIPEIFAHTLRLAPLNPDEAREAIARPPRCVGLDIEDALVKRLVDDLALDDPPHLQIVCDRLYLARGEAGRMTLAAYESLGGRRQILDEYVDEALAQLPRQRRELAVALLKALVTGRETKLPLRPEEVLEDVEGDPAEKQVVLTGLVDARLVRSLEVGGEPRYELAHEVLVEKVRGWIDETERQAKAARDLLRQEREVREWLRVETLPEREKVAYVHAQRENPYLRLDCYDLELMLRAALHEGLPAGYWVRRAAEAGLEVWPILAPWLESRQENERIRSLWALVDWPVGRALEALRAGMGDDSPRVRVAAHQALYDIGSPEALATLNTSDDLCLVPAGEFTMGSEQAREEKPVHPVTLDAFFAEKYPVTNARYDRFIEAGGYGDAQYWTPAGWQWVQRSRRTRPLDWQDEKQNRPDCPVVGVTWHEAWAYARWAGRRLLTEAEWEKAASWDVGATPRDRPRKRVYPWGDEFDQTKCNTKESGIGATTPVGQYSPASDSPYDCADMAGNAWEWTSSLYKDYPYRANVGREDPDAQGRRVLRGGSSGFTADYVRCTYRFHDTPVTCHNHCGCRCGVGVVSRRSLRNRITEALSGMRSLNVDSAQWIQCHSMFQWFKGLESLKLDGYSKYRCKT